jgi:anti-sigma B factor antagonist
MAVSVREVKDFKVIKLEGKLIAGEAVSDLRTRIHELLADDAKQLAVDLAGVEYLDSSGIGAIAAINFSAQEAGGTCRFFGASPGVMAILKTVNLHRALQLFPDESTALAMSAEARPTRWAA